MATYKAVIIGLTGIGAQRQTAGSSSIYGNIPQSHAAAYHVHPQIELVAVCDIRQTMLDNFRQTWQDVWPHLRYYTDAFAMLAEERPDIVSVVTPDHLHADLTVAAANHGAKAIFCEKPIATSLADADRMIAACEANHVLLSVDHTRRWYPLYQEARQLLRSGELGPLRSMVTSLFSQRAMLFRNGAHLIDMLHFFAEADAQWVWAELEAGFDHFASYQGDGGHNPASEPAASGYLHFTNGVRAFYESAKLDFPGAQFSLTCENGRIEISDKTLTIIRQETGGQLSHTSVAPNPAAESGLLAAVGELIQVLENGGELISSGRNARKTLEVILAMLQSHTRGNVRVNLPL
ncbi:MAG: Gfo/Idh/MocA family oxidoreductase [Chloroflexi bacterium]|nr:Gfo/Idh/MocA family oxidoreductase [Chloroflexota bacterium]